MTGVETLAAVGLLLQHYRMRKEFGPVYDNTKNNKMLVSSYFQKEIFQIRNVPSLDTFYISFPPSVAEFQE